MGLRDVRRSEPRVLRLCSVFGSPTGSLERHRSKFDPIGGMQNHTAELSRRLDRCGITQTVITTRPPGTRSHERIGSHGRVFRLGLPVPTMRQFYAVQALPLALRVAAECDVVHGHLGEDLAVLPIALASAKTARAPLVITVHCSLRHTLEVVDARTALLKALGGWIEHRAELSADAVIAITPRLQRLLRNAGLNPDSLHEIPPGVDGELFAGPFTDPFPDIARPRIVFVGRLVPQKGVQTLLTAESLLTTKGAQIILVGDGPERSAIERRIGRQRLANVHALGFVPHDVIPDVLAYADVLVLPSIYEEMGSVLLEALYMGVPVVASRVGGIPDVIRDGVTGVLTPAGDPAALAEAIDRVLREARTGRRDPMPSTHGVVQDWDAVAEAVRHVYNRVCGVAVR